VPQQTPGTSDPETGSAATDEGSTAAPACDFGKVTCGEGETDVYGRCVAGLAVDLPGGTFTMGTDAPHWPDATPAHEVTVSAFSLDRYEVSNAAFAACVACGVCEPPEQDGSFSGREPYYGNEQYEGYPVIYVTWHQAKAFCEGLGSRLPTEAEWELAARGTAGRSFPWGNDDATPGHANFEYTFGDTTPVTDLSQGSTPEGAANMAGNVWEWVADTWAAGYYAASPPADPKGPEEGPLKVARGGSYGSTSAQIRPYARASFLGTGTYSNVGFRCAQ